MIVYVFRYFIEDTVFGELGGSEEGGKNTTWRYNVLHRLLYLHLI